MLGHISEGSREGADTQGIVTWNRHMVLAMLQSRQAHVARSAGAFVAKDFQGLGKFIGCDVARKTHFPEFFTLLVGWRLNS
jgi:hypothetical protein